MTCPTTDNPYPHPLVPVFWPRPLRLGLYHCQNTHQAYQLLILITVAETAMSWQPGHVLQHAFICSRPACTDPSKALLDNVLTCLLQWSHQPEAQPRSLLCMRIPCTATDQS
jgi:hypothetical protein